MPGKRGGGARLPRILPIGVPAGADFLLERHRQFAAWGDFTSLPHQTGVDLGQTVDLGRGGQGAENQSREGQKGEAKGAHTLWL